MEYRKLQDAKVGAIGLGCEYLPWEDEREMGRMFALALESGINMLDIFMAEAGLRSAIGKALRGNRQRMFVQGHIGAVPDSAGKYERTRDLQRSKASMEDLMNRLDTDYIDVAMVHYIDGMQDYDVAVENGLFDYAFELKRQGRARWTGLSSHNPEIALRAIEEGRIDVLMFSINPAWDLQQPSEELDDLKAMAAERAAGSGMDTARERLYALCEEKGIGITAMKVFGGGRMFDEDITPFGRTVTPLQCVHYALGRPGVVSVLPGCASEEQLREVLRYFDAAPEALDYSFIASHAALSLSGKCMYCNHCRPCAADIDIAAVTRLYDQAQRFGVTQELREQYAALPHAGGDCIECGSCLPNCPFGVEVIENMRAAARLFSV